MNNRRFSRPRFFHFFLSVLAITAISGLVFAFITYQQQPNQQEVLENEVQSSEKQLNILTQDRKLISTAIPTSKKTEAEIKNEFRRNFVRKMMKHAWYGYKRLAWGYQELAPVGGYGKVNDLLGNLQGLTIVESLGTLHLMDLKQEYAWARQWVAENFTVNFDIPVSVFEVTIRFVGGLLSAYALTKDQIFLKKARDIVDGLLPAFNTPSGIPISRYRLDTSEYGSSNVAEAGTLHLELVYLSALTGKNIYKDKAMKIRKQLRNYVRSGLYPNDIDVRTGHLYGRISVGSGGDSFYEYLLKAWIQSGYEDQEALQMYLEAVSNFDSQITFAYNKKIQSDLVFLMTGNGMDHFSCFAGGMLALGANLTSKSDIQFKDNSFKSPEYLFQLGANITRTCHEAYDQTRTKLGPETFQIADLEWSVFPNHRLRPEAVESFFYLWRLTKDPKYREWAWQVADAIEKHCRTENGYSSIDSVLEENSPKSDDQPSYFMAETLKYLYLIFADENLLPMDNWVFNTEAHPLPIRGFNTTYP